VCINVNTVAYGRLKNRKGPGESFSDVILREVPEKPLETCGELEDYFKARGVPKADSKASCGDVEGPRSEVETKLFPQVIADTNFCQKSTTGSPHSAATIPSRW
jgi:hypothetical protein